MEFRERVGSDRFADIAFSDLQTDPVGAIEAGYRRLGIDFPASSQRAVSAWAGGHQSGSHGQHTYSLADFNLHADQVRERFAPYMKAFDAAI